MSSCGVYSFKGASISKDVKSVSINQFENIASLAPPMLSNTLTEALKDKFSSETKLIPLTPISAQSSKKSKIIFFVIIPLSFS